MKIVHSSDWHIGQLFYGFDRHHEHQLFLQWLVELLQREQVDVLLLSGDIFDVANPSAQATRLFYSFLQSALRAVPRLQMIITAGNHDSGARMESVRPLLDDRRVHIIGQVPRTNEGEIDYPRLLVPLRTTEGQIAAWCLAVPYLRAGDYPVVPGAAQAYAAGVEALYHKLLHLALQQRTPQQALLATGHLHLREGSLSDDDQHERQIIGGQEGISASIFPDSFTYVALGHLHRAQHLGATGQLRYCGSPLPMSFSEASNVQQVLLLQLNGPVLHHVQVVHVPVAVPLWRVPKLHANLAEVINELAALPEADFAPEAWPYLAVQVLLTAPEPSLRYRIEQALQGKAVRLAKIDLRYPVAEEPDSFTFARAEENFSQLQPIDLLEKHYFQKYKQELTADLRTLFQQAQQDALQTDAQ